MGYLHRILFVPLLLLTALAGSRALAQINDTAWAPTPPRLSYIDGEVSYWRPGAEDWAAASLNLPLAEGDSLYTGQDATLELQIGNRSFVRADEGSELSLVNQDERFMQFRVTAGLVSFDIRSIAEGDAIEVDTPHAVFTIEHPGYYRLDVDDQTIHFITHRGGRATVTMADGRALSVYPSEDLVITASNPAMVATYAAPPPDAWDKWNDERSDRLTESVSSRYLPPDVYGAEELDHYGYWRVVPEYGAVWIPSDVGPGWVPYSSGYWVWDPFYEWSWIDAAPWGWAPFHYGRWVTLGGVWCWAPGPVVRRPAYSPALVAFMVPRHGVSIGVSVGLSWVALGWGEPVLPWWGPHDYRGRPHWVGWGGPRIAFNEASYRYRNAAFPRAVLTAPGGRFGRERIRAVPETRFRAEDFAAVRGDLPVKPSTASLAGGAPRGVQPPRDILTRPVISTRPAREHALPWKETAPRIAPEAAAPPARIIRPPSLREQEANPLPRPPFGRQVGPERTPQPLPPRFGQRFGESRAALPAAPLTTPGQPAAREAPQPGSPSGLPFQRRIPRPAQPAPMTVPSAPPSSQQEPSPRQGIRIPREAGRSAPPQGEVHQERVEQSLPGQPANQMYRGQERKRRWERPDAR